jgi:hypothetical protein
VYGQINKGVMMAGSRTKNPIAKVLRTPKFKTRTIQDKRKKKRETEDERIIKKFL